MTRLTALRNQRALRPRRGPGASTGDGDIEPPVPPPAEGGELGTRRRAEGGPGPARRHRAGLLWFRGFRGPCRGFTVRSAASAPYPPTRRPAPPPETLLEAGGPDAALWSRGGRSSPGDAFGGRAGSQTRSGSGRSIPSAQWADGRLDAEAFQLPAPGLGGKNRSPGRDGRQGRGGEGGRRRRRPLRRGEPATPVPSIPAPAAPARPRRASAWGGALGARPRPRLEGGLCRCDDSGPAREVRRAISNDPSAGSPTETLLRLLLPLDSQV